ncbi:MAG: penicillin-binding protein 2 [Bacteroidales bacterium]|nr:penicillin-binding protein 2 [Bacteroidales bacterium]
MKKSQAYSNRRIIILTVIVIVSVIFLVRLSWLQLFDMSYKASASNNSRRDVTIYPSRGLIYDRNNKLLVYNEAVYDLMVVPAQTELKDTTEFANLLEIEPDVFKAKLKKAWDYSPLKQSIFEKQISKKKAGYIKEKLYKYPGFYMRPRRLRSYPQPVAAHVLGYIGEVNNKEIKKDAYYVSGDYTGKSGLEKRYEKVLRGKKGVEKLLVDVHNREMGSYMNGHYDTAAIAGKDIQSTLDIKLQQYGEKLMQNKIGSIVAIEPNSGEILALVSSPGYDPNLLVGRIRSENYNKLQNDSLNPLFNRALMAPYPPGSIFKIVQALIGLDLNVITTETGFRCNKALVGCHNHPNAKNVRQGIKYSCNPYFYNVFKRIIQQGKTNSVFTDSRLGLKEWRKEVLTFGLGKEIGLDLQNVKAGYVPSVDFYDMWYGKNRWAFSTIYSLSIGQGELEVIPIQMANLAAIFANRGYYVEPHLVKKIDGLPLENENLNSKKTGISKEYYDLVADAMQGVVEESGGTARRARIPGINVCGKTGTAENPHGEDHSAFIAFAPKENPKIAISVYVENSGFGGTWAAPIAGLMIEKYLTDSIHNPAKENRILNANFIKDATVRE